MQEMNRITGIFTLTIAFISIQLSLNAQEASKEITLEDLWVKHTFQSKSVHGIESMKDGEHYTLFEDGNINEYSYKTGEKIKTIAYGDSLKTGIKHEKIDVDAYEFTPDETKILLTTNTKMILQTFKHSDILYL